EYGRADKAAAWALLARLYLNAEVYTGTPKYTEAITYSKKVIDAGFTLIPKYKDLMTADNNTNTNEFIFTINYDGLNTQGYGGTNFLIHAAIGGSMKAADFGLAGGWGGTRTTSTLVNLFNSADSLRALFYLDGQNKEIKDVTKFTDGYAVKKFTNKTKSGASGYSGDFTDTDFPLFRLAEMYLIYAESILRGGTGGEINLAVSYINNLRQRGYGNTAGNITIANFATPSAGLNFIIDERARELYWEGFRRTDLIRFNRFTESTYLWPWKGGVSNGTGVENYRKLYPIPSTDLAANPNLKQNTGY
ncbi:MAG: RagB/SusD family nutrient uptake outer membrane protein, partial [Sediminibacterium sp.]|nr:RagB/SusD family nutrient uptake outer membrane protein [Sediminibacterium sp.]